MIGYASLHVDFVEVAHYVPEDYVPEPLHQLPKRWNARQIVWQNSKLIPVIYNRKVIAEQVARGDSNVHSIVLQNDRYS